jgi:hypothetical protein
MSEVVHSGLWYGLVADPDAFVVEIGIVGQDSEPAELFFSMI